MKRTRDEIGRLYHRNNTKISQHKILGVTFVTQQYCKVEEIMKQAVYIHERVLGSFKAFKLKNLK